MMAAYSPPCPMCGLSDKSPREPDRELKSFNFKDYPVSRPDGSEISFEEATTNYIEEFFPDLEERSYKVPAVFSYNHEEELDFVPDDDVYTMKEKPRKGPSTVEKILEDRRQKDAVERVARAFYSWGSEQLGPLFVVSNFKFSNFLYNVKCSKEDKREISATDGEHDIAVITKEHGVIFVQVKSVVGANYCNKIKKAFEQMEKDKGAIACMNRDLPFMPKLQLKGFVALPNLTMEQLMNVNFCKDHQNIILTKSDLSEKQFKSWLSSRFPKSDYAHINKSSRDADKFKQYKLLTSRYVGLASVVKLRTLSDAINKVAGKVARILLNPEQKECLEQPAKKMVLLGDYGTGKSLLLMKKAEQLLDDISINDGCVYVISFSVVSDGSGKVHDVDDNLVPYLQGTTSSEDTCKNRIFFTSFRDHLKRINRYADHFPFKLTPVILRDVIEQTNARKGNCHFFLDEVPLCLGLNDGTWQNLECFCHEHESMYVWISIATCSFTLTDGMDISDLNDYLPGVPFQRTILTRSMRMTRNGFKLLQAVREFKGDGLRQLTTCGNVIDGPHPLWLQLSPCLCGAGKNPYDCNCLAEIRLKDALEKALKRIGQVNRDDITILLHGLYDTSNKMTKFLGEVARKACNAANINYKWKITNLSHEESQNKGVDDAPKSAVTLVDLWSYKGNECKVVLFVDPFNGPVVWKVRSLWYGWVDISIASCRSLAQTIFITWPREEQRLFLEDLKTCMLKAGASAKDESIKNFYEELVNDINDGHARHGGNLDGFMEFLFKKGAVEMF